LKITYADAEGLQACAGVWGKIKLEWAQANEVLRMRVGGGQVIAVKNLLRRYQMDVGASSVHPEGPPMKGGGKG
jgi:hypothetical protein